MENKVEDTRDKFYKTTKEEHLRGKFLSGLLLVVIGSVFLAKEIGVEVPVWLFNWKMLIIGVGLVTLLKNKFQSIWGLGLILIGGGLLALDLYPALEIKPLLIPIGIILFGLFIIFKPSKPRIHRKWGKCKHRSGRKFDNEFSLKEQISDEDMINVLVNMGAVKKSVVSKTFKGGTIRNRFGSIELNLSQADFEGEIIIEVDQSFGGLEIVAPAHWEIRSDLSTGFSSVEDNRNIQSIPPGDKQKVLILRGNNFFGGIEIKNY